MTPECSRFDLSWSAVGGIDHYEVFRAEIVEATGNDDISTVAADMGDLDQVRAMADTWSRRPLT